MDILLFFWQLGMFSNQVYPDPLKGNNGDKNGNYKKVVDATVALP